MTVPDDLQSYQTRVEYINVAAGNTPLLVDVSASLDPIFGIVKWIFRSVAPDTGEPPPGALDGFLPPNDTTHRGEGFVTYTVKPKSGLATGTEVRSVASIVFDFNAPILTNQVDPHDPTKGTDPAKEALVTIDAVRPTSNVQTLPAVTNTRTFNVTWAGNDDAGGSGIGTYDVFVSVDGGAFAPWLLRTSLTSSQFTGPLKHTYAFYSVARDNSGLIELTPSVADAQIDARSAWWNSSKPNDVNGDGQVSGIDLVMIVESLNSIGGGGLLPLPATSNNQVDTNGDGFVSGIDLLLVVEELNRPAPLQLTDRLVSVAEQVTAPATQDLAAHNSPPSSLAVAVALIAPAITLANTSDSLTSMSSVVAPTQMTLEPFVPASNFVSPLRLGSDHVDRKAPRLLNSAVGEDVHAITDAVFAIDNLYNELLEYLGHE